MNFKSRRSMGHTLDYEVVTYHIGFILGSCNSCRQERGAGLVDIRRHGARSEHWELMVRSFDSIAESSAEYHIATSFSVQQHT